MQLFANFLTPEDVFIDVGANAGAFSGIANTGPCKRVIAFEPSSKTHWVTALAFRINGATPEAHQVRKQAFVSQSGTAVITNNMGSNDHIISTKDPCPGPGRELVSPSTVDSLLNEINPANSNGVLAIKIDAEGHDPDVLERGA
jgi:FkbM family methyltransferase